MPHSLLFYFFAASTLYASPMSLKEVLHYGLEHSPALQSEKLRESIAILNTRSRKAALLPTLDLNTQHGAAFTRPKTSSTEPWVSSLNLTLTETLYDNGESLTRWDQSKLNEELAQWVVSREKNRLVLELVQYFYDYSRHHYLLGARKQQRELYDKQNLTTAHQYRQGLKTRKDFLRFKAQAQRAEIDQRAQENALVKTRIQIEKSMGVTGTDPLSFEIVTVESLELQTPLKAPPVEKTPEYLAAAKEAALKRFDTNLSERKNFPQVNLTASGNYGFNNYVGYQGKFDNTKQYGAQILLGLNYNIWDWGLRRNEIDKSLAAERIGEHDLLKIKLATKADIDTLMLELSTLKANQLLTQELVRNQQEAYELIRREYEEGRLQYIDLVGSLDELMLAKILYYDAHFQLSQALAKYRYFEGTLYGSLLP